MDYEELARGFGRRQGQISKNRPGADALRMQGELEAAIASLREDNVPEPCIAAYRGGFAMAVTGL